jgi:hypothetical protein
MYGIWIQVETWNHRPAEEAQQEQVEVYADTVMKLQRDNVRKDKAIDRLKQLLGTSCDGRHKALQARVEEKDIEIAKLRCKIGTCNGGSYPICSGCYIFENKAEGSE